MFQVLSAGVDPVDPGSSAHKLSLSLSLSQGFIYRFILFYAMRFLPGAPGYQKRVLQLLELELTMVVSQCGSGNRMEASARASALNR